MPKAKTEATQRGIVLIIVVITIAILSTIAVEFIYSTRVSYEVSVNSSKELQIRHIAKSGVSLAQSVIRSRTLEDLPRNLGPLKQMVTTKNDENGWDLSISSFPLRTGNISLDIKDERSKINLNALVDQKLNKVDFQVRTQLNELFRFLEIETEKADLFVASLVNWLDRPARSIINDQDSSGAGAAHYAALENPYYIKDGPLDSVEEIRMIHGMDNGFYTKVQDYLTVYPKDKKVNFSTASKKVIMATIKAATVSVTQTGSNSRDIKDSVVDRMADSVISRRKAKRIISSSEAIKILKEMDSGLKISSGLSGVVLKNGKSDIYSVVSTAMAIEQRPVSKQVRAVVQKSSKNLYPTVISWKER